MSLVTNFLNLFKYDTTNDGNLNFNIDKAINEPLDAIDAAIAEIKANHVVKDGSVDFTAEQKGVDPVSPTGLTTLQKVQALISAIDLSNLADLNLSNLSAVGKNVVTDLVIPNYSSGVTKAVTTTYTAASNVLVVVQGTTWSTGARINLLVAGSTIKSMGDGNGAYANVFGTIEALVPKGSTYQVTVSGSYSIGSIKEYPLKGAN